MSRTSIHSKLTQLSLFRNIIKWGKFDKGLIAYATRTALASGFALACAWWLGLDHPQWAAMSVWAASSQPFQKKGMILEKSLFRLFGTLIGTIVGVLILKFSHGDILYVTLGLTAWLTLCTGAGNLIHGLFSYLTLLSGYTASLVTLLDISQGANIYELGLDRMLTVSLGVLIVMVVGLIFNKASNEEVISVRAKLLTHSVLTLLAQAVHSPISHLQIASLVKEAAAIDELLLPHSAGSLRSRRSVRSIRAIIYSNISLLTRLETTVLMAQLTPIKSHLQQLANVVENDMGLDKELQCLDEICKALPNRDLNTMFNDLYTALAEQRRYKEKGKVTRRKLRHMVVMHRDWVAARQAMLRTFIVLGGIGILWNWTGSPIGAFIMLGTSVMVTLFSTFEAPASMMGRMFIWQIVGLAASLLLKGYFWKNASNEGECIMFMIIFILPVIIPLSSTRFGAGAMDYVMMYLLLSNIEYPVNFQLSANLPIGLAAVTGTLVAFLAFSLIFPTNRVKRSSRIKRAMLNDLQRIYNIEWNREKIAFIHCQSQHRLLKLIQTEPLLSTNQILESVKISSTIQLIGRIRNMLAMDQLNLAEREKATQALDQLMLAINTSKSENTHSEQRLNTQQHYDELLNLLA